MRIFKFLILLLTMTISSTMYAAGAAEPEHEARAAAAAAPVAEPARITTGGILSPIVATFLSHEITADNARQHFQDLRDRSVDIFAIGKNTYELDFVTAANRAARRGHRIAPHPLSESTLSVSIGRHMTALREVYSSVPNEIEISLTKLIARCITSYAEADIRTILRTTREVSLSPVEANLWVLLWEMHLDSCKIFAKDARGERDYLETLRTNVIPVMRAYSEWRSSVPAAGAGAS